VQHCGERGCTQNRPDCGRSTLSSWRSVDLSEASDTRKVA
jgi:hypothetical protein